MARKSALYGLAVAALMGAMAVVALADDHGMNTYQSPNASFSADPERSLGWVDSAEIREPVETGAVPDQSVGSSELFRQSTGEEPTVEIGGREYRPSVDLGP